MRSWRVLSSRPLLDRLPWLRIWEEDVRLPGGLTIRGYLRAESRAYAMVFALLPDGMVPVVWQYKHGVGRLTCELPAGYLNTPDELPLAAAQRELREETGLAAQVWQPLGHLVIDTNRGDTRAHLFLALDAQQVGRPDPDPTEVLEVTFHRPAELCQMVFNGQIDSLASAAAIMMAVQKLSQSE